MAETTPRDSLPDIIYLMGTGRSGTTILEILLSNSPDLYGVGEVTHIFNDGFIRNLQCSCGLPARRCDLWANVKAHCNWDDESLSLKSTLFHRHAWHSRFPAQALGLESRAELQDFRETNFQLFSAVQSLTGAKAVVDSSKYAARALALARAFPGKVRIICVTRSPGALIAAFRRIDTGEQPSKGLLAACLYYAYVMTCLRFTLWRLEGQVMHVRHEDLCLTPVDVLGQIGNFIQRDLSETISRVVNNDWLRIEHIVTGNRIRMNRRIKFKPNGPHQEFAGPLESLAAMLMGAYRRILGI